MVQAAKRLIEMGGTLESRLIANLKIRKICTFKKIGCLIYSYFFQIRTRGFGGFLFKDPIQVKGAYSNMVRNILQYKFFLVMIDQEGYYILHKSDIRRMVCMGLASFASTKTRLFHFVQIKVKLHIYFFRLFGSTGRSAVYAGCFHSGKKQPVILTITRYNFLPHFFKRKTKVSHDRMLCPFYSSYSSSSGFCKILI